MFRLLLQIRLQLARIVREDVTVGDRALEIIPTWQWYGQCAIIINYLERDPVNYPRCLNSNVEYLI